MALKKEVFAAAYARRIIRNEITINDVPTELRELVIAELQKA